MHDGTEWADAPKTQIQNQTSSRSYAEVASLKLTNIGLGTSGNPDVAVGRSERPSTPPSLLLESDSIQCQKGASDNSDIPTFGVHSLQHKAEVAPIFLGYNRVNAEGQHIPLVQVTAAIVQVMGNPDLLDAVQPMKNGWYIYMTTNADRTRLVSLGLNVAGKYIELRSDTRAGKSAIKVTLKDLPLHSISNEDVLDALKQHCTVASEVKYSNLWYNGRLTGVCMGDRFIYVSSAEVSKLPNLLDMLTYKARVIKPSHMSQYKCYGQLGHHLSDLSCPAKAVDGVVETVETFQGGKC